jgi:hypothetical protein
LAFTSQDIWLGILAFFIFAQARAGWRAAQNLALEAEKAAHRDAAISPPLFRNSSRPERSYLLAVEAEIDDKLPPDSS